MASRKRERTKQNANVNIGPCCRIFFPISSVQQNSGLPLDPQQYKLIRYKHKAMHVKIFDQQREIVLLESKNAQLSQKLAAAESSQQSSAEQWESLFQNIKQLTLLLPSPLADDASLPSSSRDFLAHFAALSQHPDSRPSFSELGPEIDRFLTGLRDALHHRQDASASAQSPALDAQQMAAENADLRAVADKERSLAESLQQQLRQQSRDLTASQRSHERLTERLASVEAENEKMSLDLGEANRTITKLNVELESFRNEAARPSSPSLQQQSSSPSQPSSSSSLSSTSSSSINTPSSSPSPSVTGSPQKTATPGRFAHKKQRLLNTLSHSQELEQQSVPPLPQTSMMHGESSLSSSSSSSLSSSSSSSSENQQQGGVIARSIEDDAERKLHAQTVATLQAEILELTQRVEQAVADKLQFQAQQLTPRSELVLSSA